MTDRTTEEILKDAKVLIAGSKQDGKGFIRDVLVDSMAILIAELSAKLRESEKALKDAKIWRRHYEREYEYSNCRVESYGRRLNAIREGYFSEDVPPGIEELVEKYELTPPKKEKG